jgi:IclR family transcriptional regulator, acetate operon repressor
MSVGSAPIAIKRHPQLPEGPGMSPGSDLKTVIDRVFAILGNCAESRRTMSLADLARSTGLPKSTLHRLCGRLVAIGALEPRVDGYRIGRLLFSLGALNPAVLSLRTHSMPALARMSADTGLSANLAVLHADKVLFLDEVFRLERAVPRFVGTLLPLHATALGKALLSVEPPFQRKALLGPGPLQRFTRKTTTDVDRLLQEVELAKGAGVATSFEELRPGLFAVAAPIVVDGVGQGVVALSGMPRARDVKSYRGIVAQAAAMTAETLKRPVIRDASRDFAEPVES